jgi:hypothetical protein
MAIVINSGFLAAVAAVKVYFTEKSITADVSVGWKRRWRQDNQGTGGANRVVFTPSGDAKGGGGKIIPPRFPGERNVRASAGATPTATIRSLVEWERSVMISVWAVDNSAREDEAAQIEATEDLFEWTVRAIHGAPGAFANLVWGDVTWTPPPERAFGLELQCGLTFRHPIFSEPTLLKFPTVAAVARKTPIPSDAAPPAGDT